MDRETCPCRLLCRTCEQSWVRCTRGIMCLLKASWGSPYPSKHSLHPEYLHNRYAADTPDLLQEVLCMPLGC